MRCGKASNKVSTIRRLTKLPCNVLGELLCTAEVLGGGNNVLLLYVALIGFRRFPEKFPARRFTKCNVEAQV